MDIKTTKTESFLYGAVRKPGAKTVSLYITSSVLEANTSDNTAMGLLYSDLILSGSDKLSRDEFQFKLNELGSTISAAFSDGKFSFHLSATKEKVKKTLSLLELMLTKPAFKGPELKRASRTLVNALLQHKEDAKSIAHDALKNSFFTADSQHYSHSPELLMVSVASTKLSEFKTLHAKVMSSPWSVTVGAADEVVDMVFKNISKLKKTNEAPTVRDDSAFIGLNNRQVITHEVPSKQNIELSIGGYLPLTLQDGELPAFVFGLSVLGKLGSFAGRLMSTVREKEGLTYGIYAQVLGISANEVGYWRIMTFFSPKDVVKGITSTLREVKQIQSKGITESELTRFKTILKTADSLIFDSLNGATTLVHNRLVGGQSWEEHLEFRNRLYSCTRSEVNKALKEYLNPESITISAAGPIATVKKELEQFSK